MWKLSLKLVETNIFGKDDVLVERDFPPCGNCFLLFSASFLKVETVTELVETSSFTFYKWPFLISK